MPPKGSETRSNGQPAPREFGYGLVSHPQEVNGSWWCCDPKDFALTAAREQARMNQTSTNYQTPENAQ